jgi:hypothetical protein
MARPVVAAISRPRKHLLAQESGQRPNTVSAWIRQLGAPERAVVGRDGKARTAAMACAMARIRNAASVVEGSSIGCAALSPCW